LVKSSDRLSSGWVWRGAKPPRRANTVGVSNGTWFFGAVWVGLVDAWAHRQQPVLVIETMEHRSERRIRPIPNGFRSDIRCEATWASSCRRVTASDPWSPPARKRANVQRVSSSAQASVSTLKREAGSCEAPRLVSTRSFSRKMAMTSAISSTTSYRKGEAALFLARKDGSAAT
jgi:hypothetical protein